jgi:hypothetical protein
MDNREFLQALLDWRGDGSKVCSRCGCCEVVAQECEQCDEGLDGHDCGEDCCCCEDPESNMPCEFCRGRGYFEVCLGRCDNDGKHSAAVQRPSGGEG